MAAITIFGVLLLSCALGTLSFPAIEKRQIDPISSMCAQMIADNATLSYTVGVGSDCTKFAQCLPDGGYIEGNCSAGLLFDPLLLRCQYANLVNCATNPCSGRIDGSAVDDPRGCAHFYGCNGGVAIPLSCPNGQRFSGNTCVPDANCGYVEQTTVFMSPAEMCLAKGMKPYPGDPSMYISVHAGGVEVEMPCAPGTVFDETCSCVFQG